ncbi:hypothetical protein DTO006G1_8203 [Penicillium roqueforti]|uniref:uncharacterized protein n=1 Tax=Penicillium roqueforti TaxID=5082 RepID=UPI00190E5B01|nr:uncharacterized protein LCP9604111_8839 [Penicillium roqueforti]KAF9240361.1 hypothetical protein LCP9604111_8839 [Penicillium roqueforti]KAI1835266.1 hypothetical protein CBS147337_4083 [Penicillium roqueforti]KAI2677279.1 hypothetical protein CBS147355_5506 [Penicillium roqueforti]KAI2688424.1 hypothetical protein LCP963914a_2826 [Penicillium roqueforti]KAI2700601.1 hypothetical protein CBS147372_5380 [Penicillium roqueforti]
MLGQLVGSVMLLVATAIFLYYTAWTLLMPFVDPGHPLHDIFPPRVWAIRIPVILTLLASAVGDLRSRYAVSGVYVHHNSLIFKDTVKTVILLFSHTSQAPGSQLGS